MFYVMNNLITGSTIFSGPHRSRAVAERNLRSAPPCAYIAETETRLSRKVGP